jgi:hypothetical protein
MPEKSKQPENHIEYSRRHSFLLRLWCSQEDGVPDWRASLEIPETGKRIGFTGLEQLFTFLMDLSEKRGDLSIPDE